MAQIDVRRQLASKEMARGGKRGVAAGGSSQELTHGCVAIVGRRWKAGKRGVTVGNLPNG